MSVVDIRTLPWGWINPAVLQLERERIFRRSWQYVGHTGDVPEPGSFAANWLATFPSSSSATRRTRSARFLNVCRHRGSLVCEGPGRERPSNAPTTPGRTDSTGASSPRRVGTGRAGSTRRSSASCRCVSRPGGRSIFVNPDADADPLADFLDGLPERSPTQGIDLNALRFLQRSESELACNWKISAENFLECYHCPTAHPGFSAVMDVNPDSYLLETSAGRMTQHGPPRREPRGTYDPTGEVERGQFHLLFPGTVVNVMPGRPNFSIGPMFPRAPERTYRFLDYFVAQDADEAWIEESLAFDAQVGAEDRVLVERVQAGIRAGLVEHGQLLPESERLIAHFQSLVVEALA